jgi:hypothetical protein
MITPHTIGHSIIDRTSHPLHALPLPARNYSRFRRSLPTPTRLRLRIRDQRLMLPLHAPLTNTIITTTAPLETFRIFTPIMIAVNLSQTSLW